MKARTTIFLGASDGEQELEDGILWEYSGGIFQVFKLGQVIFERSAEPYEGFELITIKGNSIHVSPITPPRKDEEIVPWLMGLGKHQRANSPEKYQEILKKVVEKYGKDHLREGYMFYSNMAVTFLTTDEGDKAVAAYIAELPKTKDVLWLIPYMKSYPEGYTQKVLASRFGISDQTFQEAKRRKTT